MKDVKLKNFKYGTFGLRKEWIDLFFRTADNFFQNNNLGSKQYNAFIYYLRDTYLIDKKRNLTELYKYCKYLFNNHNELLLWSIFWINLCFNSSIFNWWTYFKEGEYTKEQIIQNLTKSYQKFNRYLLNAYMSLVSTFERTPIGDQLKQGKVIKQGNQRIVIKEGNPDVPFQTILYNLYKFAEYYKMYSFTLKKIENIELSPQKIFAMETSKVENILKKSWNSSIFKVNFSDNEPLFILNSELTSLDVLSILIGGKDEI